MTLVEAGEARLLPKAAAAIRTQIRLHGGNEVCFVCTVDADGNVDTARKVAAGDVQSVLALPGVAERGELLVHNHPSGELTPSDADMQVAFGLHGNGVGFAIVNNDATRIYFVTEIPTGKTIVPVNPDDVDVALGPYGLIAQAMKQVHGARNYEDRPSQRGMAAEVTAAFNEGGVALLEAGTGVGKSLGYLGAGSCAWAAANGERTVVSTNTITLQEQLVAKGFALSTSARSPISRCALRCSRDGATICASIAWNRRRGPEPALFENNVTEEVEKIRRVGQAHAGWFAVGLGHGAASRRVG
ncbi:MAG: hypothetical protein HEQ38_12535 [Gemmatimonas sp.]|nr:hypothetical protein [Gemmatimonas sp.]